MVNKNSKNKLIDTKGVASNPPQSFRVVLTEDEELMKLRRLAGVDNTGVGQGKPVERNVLVNVPAINGHITSQNLDNSEHFDDDTAKYEFDMEYQTDKTVCDTCDDDDYKHTDRYDDVDDCNELDDSKKHYVFAVAKLDDILEDIKDMNVSDYKNFLHHLNDFMAKLKSITTAVVTMESHLKKSKKNCNYGADRKKKKMY